MKLIIIESFFILGVILCVVGVLAYFRVINFSAISFNSNNEKNSGVQLKPAKTPEYFLRQ